MARPRCFAFFVILFGFVRIMAASSNVLVENQCAGIIWCNSASDNLKFKKKNAVEVVKNQTYKSPFGGDKKHGLIVRCGYGRQLDLAFQIDMFVEHGETDISLGHFDADGWEEIYRRFEIPGTACSTHAAPRQLKYGWNHWVHCKATGDLRVRLC